MFKVEETGPEVRGDEVRFNIYLPSIEQTRGFGVRVYVIDKAKQFDPAVRATP